MNVRYRVLGAVTVLVVAAAMAGCNGYVALGDSYTAGPLITPQDPAVPGCLRSDVNYPELIQPNLRFQISLTDVSCSGAQTEDMFSSQDVDPDPDNPPQLDALHPGIQLVTLGVGGNDIGFTEIASKCVELGIQDPFGSPCEDFYTQGGTDQIAARLAALVPDLEAVLDEIHLRSPMAKVFVVGYPAILPETTDAFFLCQPVLPVAQGDVPYLRDQVEKALNATIESVTVGRGDTFVDTYTPSIGHDACQIPSVRWVEPLIPAADAAPVHPNRAGMQATARAVEASMRVNGVHFKI